jgi:hypothetical protein
MGEVEEPAQNVVQFKLPSNLDRWPFSFIFSDQRQQLRGSPVTCSGVDEVVALNEIRVRGTKSATESIVEPRSSLFCLFLGDTEALVTEDSLRSLLVDVPYSGPK